MIPLLLLIISENMEVEANIMMMNFFKSVQRDFSSFQDSISIY